MKVFSTVSTLAIAIVTALPLAAEASPAIDTSTTVDRSSSSVEVSLTRRSCGARRFSRPRYYRYW